MDQGMNDGRCRYREHVRDRHRTLNTSILFVSRAPVVSHWMEHRSDHRFNDAMNQSQPLRHDLPPETPHILTT